jgi:hypothetical protein
VGSATGRGSDLWRFRGSGTSGHRVFSIPADEAMGSAPRTIRDGRRGSQCNLAKTGKRTAKIGRTAAKMKHPTVATRRMMAGIRPVGDSELCWILAYLGQNASSTKRDKAKEKNESDREIRKSGGTNRNKQWDKKARTLQSNKLQAVSNAVGLAWVRVTKLGVLVAESW